MNISKNLKYLLIASSTLLASCDDFLDRPEKTKVVDENFWRSQADISLYANDFYQNYFVGYNSGFGTAYAPLRGYTFADDFSSEGKQGGFETTVPTSRGATTGVPTMLTQYSGPSWNFYWVRKANVMINRIDTKAKPNLTVDEYNHWSSVARFFRGFEYSRLVSVFGDVPYYANEVDPTNFDEMYKDRTSRGEVMDAVYEDFKYALTNMRNDDGRGMLNKYVAAAAISNLMLFEGSWLHYHGIDAPRSKKYLELAVEASQLVMNSGKFNFSKDFKSLFASEDLNGHPEVIMYRDYNLNLKVTHSIGSYSNGTEGQASAANLNLLKSYICADGEVFQNSKEANASKLNMKDMARSRDPRFEATFQDGVNEASVSLAYVHKFASREALTFIGSTYPAIWTSNTNTNDAPVYRLSEVVLNFIEAKQILAEFHGGAAVTQADLDASINAIRKRPLDAAAIAKGVKQTAPLTLTKLPVDPSRDTDVSQLMWEIRRERRMEFVYEHTRLNDIRRWKKLNYMDFQNADYSTGPWVDFQKELPARLNSATYLNRLKVIKEDGSVVTYNGSNKDQMVGYYVLLNFSNRPTFTNASYLSPIGLNEIQNYADRGYKLTQNPGWL